MSDLPIVALGDIVRVKGGKRLPKGSNLQTVPNDHPYIRVRDMGERYIPDTGLEYVPDVIFPKIQRYIVEENDVIISIVGTIGLVSVIDERFHLASQTENCAKLSGLDLIDALYVYYYLSSNIGQQSINEATVGAVQAKLPLYNIEKIPVIWPERKERELIVSNLGVLDNKIELNHQTNQTLEQIAQAIFKSWFVDFEPTRAKIAAKKRWQALHQSIESSSPTCYAEQLDSPNKNASSLDDTMTQVAMAAISGKTEEQLKELDDAQGSANVAGGRKPGATEAALQQLKTAAALFPDALVESELGEVPEGWGVQTVEDVIELAYGKALKKTDRVDGEYPVYGSGGLTGVHNQYLVDGPGIIVGRKGTVGSLYWEDKSFYPIDTVFYVKCKNHMTVPFSFYLLQILGLEDMNTDAAVPGLNRNNVYRLELPKYPNELIEVFTNIVSKMRGKIKYCKDETETLGVLRDTLLPKLLSGAITPNERQSIAKEVA